MAPRPSVRSLFTRSKDTRDTRVSKEPIKKPDPKLVKQIITDDDILASIDEIYIQAKELLSKKRFAQVVETFLYLTEYDILFKKIISSQLANIKADFYWPENLVLNEDIMSFLIMIQSYFNSFRINLLTDVVDFLYENNLRFKDALKKQ